MTRIELARCVRRLREDLYGDEGIPALADALGLPARTWENFERGVTMPAEVLLRLLEVTGVSLDRLTAHRSEPDTGAEVTAWSGPAEMRYPRRRPAHEEGSRRGTAYARRGQGGDS